ncbi:MAG: UDP-3-O-(3-hydroxymyristoyl)glucosamine N-acyltransferase [Candidatus Brocadiales bacterium]
MEYTLSQIHSITGGTLVGDGSVKITGVGSLEAAGPGDISFVKEEGLVKSALCTRATALVTHRDIPELGKPLIVVENPFLAFIRFLQLITERNTSQPKGVHPLALVSKGASLGKDASVGAHSVVEEGAVIGDNVTIHPMVYVGRDTRVGDETVIYPQVTVRESITIGKRVVIHSGTVIGGDGFGYLQVEGRHVKIPQVGTVEIGDDVEIGCNVTIDRATMDKTVIARGVKIDNHSHVAHNVVIGEDSMLIAYAKIAGGAVIGKNVMIAEDVGVTDHAVVGDGSTVGGGANVYKSIPPGSVVWGSPAKPIMEEKRLQAILKKLPEMRDTLKELSKELLKEKGR